MFTLVVGLLLAALYVHLRSRDRRMLRNGVVLVLAAVFLLSGVLGLLVDAVPPVALLVLILLALLPLAILALSGFLVVNGVTVLHREGLSAANSLSLLAGLAIPSLPVVAWLLVGRDNPIGIGLAALWFFLAGYLGVVFVVFLVYAVVYSRAAQRTAPAAVVILGAQIIRGQVPPLLRARLDTAIEVYRRAVVPPLLIPSGGQGTDESRPEGEAMGEYLIEQGIPARDVLPETRSTTTAENLRLSAEVQRGSGRTGPILAVTNNYHALRAALLARRLKLDAEVIGAPTARYYMPSAFLREFAAVLRAHLLLHCVLLLPFAGLAALLAYVASLHV